MPDLVVQSMLQRDVLGVLADFRAGLERLFAAYTADKVGVVMEWEEVVYAKMALSQERFITLAAATGIFPLLSKEDLSAIFAAVLDNSEGARERISLGERLAFPHFQELLCLLFVIATAFSVIIATSFVKSSTTARFSPKYLMTLTATSLP